MPASISEYTPQLVRDEGSARRGRAAWWVWGLTVAFAAALVALIVLAVLPTTVDFALGFFGIWENTHWSRFLTALVAGAVAAFYIVPGLVDLGLSRVRRPEGFSPAGI